MYKMYKYKAQLTVEIQFEQWYKGKLLEYECSISPSLSVDVLISAIKQTKWYQIWTTFE
jgi:hypothetical protein